MALIGVLLGEVLDALQADETAAHTVNEQRDAETRRVDNRVWADEQTHDLQRWLGAPDQVDFTTEDTPGFHKGVYDPLEEEWREEW